MATIRDTLKQAIQLLTQAKQQSARLDAQVLLRHILEVDRALLYAYPEREVTAEQAQQFLRLVERRRRGEPIAYLVGHEEFYGLDFFVDKRVLIPRPETELLVEAALGILRRRLDAGQKPIVADIGTGSGVIPITLAVEEPRLSSIYACDISADALDVACLNCQRHAVEERVHLLQGDLVAPLPEPVDVLTANLPYVGTDEIDVLTPGVYDYEPHLALFAGLRGLDLLQRFFVETQQLGVLKPGAVMLLEIGYQQREALTHLLGELYLQATVTWKKDYAGWDRVLQVQV